jgi:chromosome segregation ATPase
MVRLIALALAAFASASSSCVDDQTWNEGACVRFAAYEVGHPGTISRFCAEGRPELRHCRKTCDSCDSGASTSAPTVAQTFAAPPAVAGDCVDDPAWGANHKCSDLAEYVAIKPSAKAKFCAAGRAERTHCKKTCGACPLAPAATVAPTVAPKTCAQLFEVGALTYRPQGAMCFANLELYLEEHHCYEYSNTHVVDACKKRNAEACICAKTYAPVKCSNDQTYANLCTANCDYASGCSSVAQWGESLADARAELHTLFTHNQQVASQNGVLSANVTSLVAARATRVAQLAAERERAGVLLKERDALAASLAVEKRSNDGFLIQVTDLSELLKAAKDKVASLAQALHLQNATAAAELDAAATDAAARRARCTDDLTLFRARSGELGSALNRTKEQLAAASTTVERAQAETATLNAEKIALQGEVSKLTGQFNATSTSSAGRIAVLTAWNAKISDDQQKTLEKHQQCTLALDVCTNSATQDKAMHVSDAADMQTDIDESKALHASCEARFANTSSALRAADAARTALQVSLAQETAALAIKSAAFASSQVHATALGKELLSVSTAKASCTAAKAACASSLEAKTVAHLSCGGSLAAEAAAKLVLQSEAAQCREQATNAATETDATETALEARLATLASTLRVTNGTLLLEKAQLTSENEALAQEKAECGAQLGTAKARHSQLRSDFVAAADSRTKAQAQWETLRFDLDTQVASLTASIEQTTSASSLAKTLCHQMNASHTAQKAHISASLSATNVLLQASATHVRELEVAATATAVEKLALQAKLRATAEVGAANATRMQAVSADLRAQKDLCDTTYSALRDLHRATTLRKTALAGQVAIANATLTDVREELRTTAASLTQKIARVVEDAAKIASLDEKLSTETARAGREAAGGAACQASLQAAIAEFDGHKTASNASFTTCTGQLVASQAAASHASAELAAKTTEAGTCAAHLATEVALHLTTKGTMSSSVESLRAEARATNSSHAQCVQRLAIKSDEAAACLGDVTREELAKETCVGQKTTLQAQLASVGAEHSSAKDATAKCHQDLARQDAKLNQCLTNHADANATSVALAASTSALSLSKDALSAEVTELRAEIAVSAKALEAKGAEVAACAAAKAGEVAAKVACLTAKAAAEQSVVESSAAHDTTKSTASACRAQLAVQGAKLTECEGDHFSANATSTAMAAQSSALGLEKAALSAEVARLGTEVAAVNAAKVTEVGALAIQKDTLAAQVATLTTDLTASKKSFDVDGDGKVGPIDTTAFFLVVNVPEAYGGVQMLSTYFQKLDTPPAVAAQDVYSFVRKGIKAAGLVTVSEALVGASNRR